MIRKQIELEIKIQKISCMQINITYYRKISLANEICLKIAPLFAIFKGFLNNFQP